MSAVLRPTESWLPMSESDLAMVHVVESDIYEFPWTVGNFRDSIASGYDCRVLRDGADLIGYAVLMSGAGEAHLLNLSVARAWQGRGVGSRMLARVLDAAREAGSSMLFLEVRPSNEVGRQLYARRGFRQVGLRKNYYPARNGREDALVLAINLQGGA